MKRVPQQLHQNTLARAMSLHQEGRLQAAAALYRAILAATPDHFDALHLLGVTTLQSGDTATATPLLRRAVALAPKNGAARMHYAHALQQQGQLDAALQSFELALALSPGDPVAMNNCASLLRQMGRHDEALALFARALDLAPDYAEACNNLGGTLVDLQRHDEALAWFARALALAPGHADALYNRGNALQLLNRTGEALASYAEALEKNPDDVDARFNAGICRLLEGDLAGGWPGYEWRWRKAHYQALRPPFADPALAWRGDAPAGKRILLWSEQGFGDTLQLCRYAAPLAALGATVILRVQPALRALLAGLPGVQQVLAEGEPLPPFDLHCPLMSLPLAFGTTLADIPAAVSYLHANAARAAAWEARLPGDGRPRVGLAWSGNGGHANDAQRSIALERCAALLAHEAAWISLQREVRAADLPALAGGPLRDVAVHLGDFAETAALIAGLDLVISVDTSVAHLAAAMGKPVWLLLPFAPDWRWLLARGDSPWYPTMRLFRQPRQGDWEAVLAAAARALPAFIQGRA